MQLPTKVGAARRAAARKVLGSVAAVSAAGAVAGLGTFGTFTDSTAVPTAITSATVSIDLSVPGGPKTVPVTTSGFVAGDSLTRAVTLTNDGDSSLSGVSLVTTATPSTALVTDTVNGLQLTLRSCSRAWTRDTSTTVPTYTCGGTERTVYAGPALVNQLLSNPASLNPGGSDQLVFTLTLPTTAGDQMQGLGATVSLAFTAVQRDSTSR